MDIYGLLLKASAHICVKLLKVGGICRRGLAAAKGFRGRTILRGEFFRMGKVAGHIYSPPFAANYKKIRKLIRRIYNIKKIRFLELNVLNLQSKV